MRFPRILRSIVYDHSPINPTSIYFSPCRSHRILDPARRIAKLSRNKRRFNKIRLRYYSFPMFTSELFLVFLSILFILEYYYGILSFSPKREEETSGVDALRSFQLV